MSNEAMEVSRPGPSDLALWKEPARVLSEAKQACDALQQILSGKKKPVFFNGEQYIEFEDWQVLGQFYGYCPKVESTEQVEFTDFDSGELVQGFKATAVLIYERTGEVVSRAESMCLNNEEQWGKVTEYKWEPILKDGKKQWDQTLFKGKGGYISEKVAVGTKSKALFQLMSMAQTRACAKVMRNKLSWVVVMAGFKATPAEELTRTDDDQGQEPSGNSKAGTSVKCDECNATGGHLPKCSHKAQTDAKPKPKAEAKPKAEKKAKPEPETAKAEPVQESTPSPESEKKKPVGSMTEDYAVFVNDIQQKQTTGGNPYLMVDVVGNDKKPWIAYCFHQNDLRKSLLAYAKGRLCRISVSSKENKEGVVRHSIEALLEVGGVGEFQDNKPIAGISEVDDFDEAVPNAR